MCLKRNELKNTDNKWLQKDCYDKDHEKDLKVPVDHTPGEEKLPNKIESKESPLNQKSKQYMAGTKRDKPTSGI